MNPHALTALVDAELPQTQCTRCGFADCRAYAEAIAQNDAPINRCPPGGAEGVVRLARLTGQPVEALDPAHGVEGPRRLAVIDEAWCIGCTLCIKACPVDCIVGAPKQMHTVIEDQCTGCELCIPACPVDCISLIEASDGRTGWNAWSPALAQRARERYGDRQRRRGLEATTAAQSAAPGPRAAAEDAAPQSVNADEARRAAIQAAVARSRERKSAS